MECAILWAILHDISMSWKFISFQLSLNTLWWPKLTFLQQLLIKLFCIIILVCIECAILWAILHDKPSDLYYLYLFWVSTFTNGSNNLIISGYPRMWGKKITRYCKLYRHITEDECCKRRPKLSEMPIKQKCNVLL